MCEFATETKAPRERIEPEKLLAELFKDDLNVDIHPQALRMFIRTRWSRISTLAHNNHGPLNIDAPFNFNGA